MDFPMDHVASEQACVLAGLTPRFPEYDYSILDLLNVDVLRLARVLADLPSPKR